MTEGIHVHKRDQRLRKCVFNFTAIVLGVNEGTAVGGGGRWGGGDARTCNDTLNLHTQLQEEEAAAF